MAGPSNQAQSIEDPDEPLPAQSELSSGQRDALQATELERIRSNYSRASAPHPQRQPRVTARKPTKVLELLDYNVRKFWRSQVSVTVDHECCRDHLGMMDLYSLITFIAICCSNVRIS